jgi:hypothetical protein
MLPAQQLAQLAAGGGGLRVVISAAACSETQADCTAAPRSQIAAAASQLLGAQADFTLHAEDSGWPAGGVLQLAVPTSAGTALTVHVLATPGRGCQQRHGDRLLAWLPVLLLPRACMGEVLLLWASMVQQHQAMQPQQQQPPQQRRPSRAGGSHHALPAAATAFQQCWLPFARDLGALLQRGAAAGQLQATSLQMLAFLQVSPCGPRTCLQLPGFVRHKRAGTGCKLDVSRDAHASVGADYSVVPVQDNHMPACRQLLCSRLDRAAAAERTPGSGASASSDGSEPSTCDRCPPSSRSQRSSTSAGAAIDGCLPAEPPPRLWDNADPSCGRRSSCAAGTGCNSGTAVAQPAWLQSGVWWLPALRRTWVVPLPGWLQGGAWWPALPARVVALPWVVPATMSAALQAAGPW